MLIDIFSSHPYFTLSVISFAINLPLGYIREYYPRFSFQWLFWIHASIPLIIYFRNNLGTSKLFIPVSIFLAVIGQIIGSRWRQRMRSQQETEDLQRIGDLNLNKKQSLDDANVMVVLLNMGGPKTNADIKDFQKRLFSDRKLIRFPLGFLLQKPFAWLLSTIRLKAAQERYQLIGGGSPIFNSTRQQAKALQTELTRRGRSFDVIFSFNYSEPLPDSTIQEIQKANKKYILPLSLYPHYSNATTGSNLYHLKKSAQRIYPQLKFLAAPAYYLHDNYIQAFVERIYEQIHEGEMLDDFYLVFSAHGLPLYCLREGDPYPFQIAQTVSKILGKLKRTNKWITAYQSAVGPLEWLKPSTDDVIAALAKRGITKILIIPISFVTDHIETSCEIDMEYRQFAEKLGIKDFRMSNAIESHPDFIKALADAVEELCSFSQNTMSLSL